MKRYIYALYDPRFPNNIRYVGCTENFRRRINTHASGGDETTGEWVKFLIAEGVPLSFKVLEMVDDRIAFARERHWIAKLADKHDLINKPQAANDFEFPPSGVCSLAEMEAKYILWVLDGCKGNKLEASKLLGIGRQTLYNKLGAIQAQKPS